MGGRQIPFDSHIISLADTIARSLDLGVPALEQSQAITNKINDMSGKVFHPDCVDAFREASKHPAFWLDCVSDRIYGVILEQMDWPSLTIDEEMIEPIATIFAHVVDAASHWTATHTAGVAATAVELAKCLNFSPRELRLMRAAGLLHDLGKLVVSRTILDKNGQLSPQEWNIMRAHTYHTFRILNTIGGMPQICEWASFHHERLDGNGYPFGHDASQLTLGSRVMAVADVFAAITEDRPYRAGMTRDEAMAVLDKQVAGNALDGQVVAVLKKEYDIINKARRSEQATYKLKQDDLLKTIESMQQPGGASRA
jgi:HD-GYP domain-containing protein (c-di-GMP phosphodiesterase class II)